MYKMQKPFLYVILAEIDKHQYPIQKNKATLNHKIQVTL